MWKFIVDVVHDFVSSLQPDVGRGFLHVSNVFFLPLRSSGWRGIVVTVRAGGRLSNLRNPYLCTVTAWLIFSIWSSVELSRPVVVHCHGHLPICPIWACPWAKNLSNFPQIGSRLCGTHISETAGLIYPIESFMDLSRSVVVQRHSYLPICPIYGLAHGPKTSQIRQHLGQTLRNPYLWNHWMDLSHLKFYGIV